MSSAPHAPNTRDTSGATADSETPVILEYASGPKPTSSTRRAIELLTPALLAVVVLVVFAPVLRNDFVGWDDDQNLLLNTDYRGLGPSNLRWMFTTFLLGHYQPLSWVSFGLDYLLWGMDPTGYHLTNLLIHAANAVLVFYLARELLRLGSSLSTRPAALSLAAALAAGLFALHPLRVESVAWTTQRRDVLGGFFYLLAVLAYLRAHRRGRRGPWLAASLGAMALSLLSKATAATLPAVLLVLDAYPLRRPVGGWKRNFCESARGVWLEKLPFLVLAAAGAALAVAAQAHSQALEPLSEYGLGRRLAQASFGLAFYLYKLLLPVGLSPLYEVPVRFHALEPAYVMSGILVLAMTAGLVALRRRWPSLLAAWVCYVALLSPVLGTFQSGRQFAADRYTYLPCVGWCVLAGGALLRFGPRAGSASKARSPSRNAVPAILAGLLLSGLAALMGLTRAQIGVWHDSQTLWRHVLTIDPHSPTAHDNLGVALLDLGRIEEAIAEHRRAYDLRPQNPETCHRLAYALAQAGRFEVAARWYEQALANDPSHVPSRINLANLLDRMGRVGEAIEQLGEVIRVKPGFPDASFHLGRLLLRQSRFAETIRIWRAGLQYTPDHVDMTVELAALLTACPDPNLRDAAEALRLAERACRLTGESNARALLAKAAALEQLQRLGLAIATLEKALAVARAGADGSLTAAIEALLADYRSRESP